MPISGTGRRIRSGRAQAGLTLLELVIVVAILSVLALPAALRFGGGGLLGGTPAAERVAAALRADLGLLRDRALLGRAFVDLTPAPDGWQGGGDGRPARFPGMRLTWRPDGTDPGAIRFLPDGRGTPFALTIAPAEGAAGPRLDCRFDGWEGLECR